MNRRSVTQEQWLLPVRCPPGAGRGPLQAELVEKRRGARVSAQSSEPLTGPEAARPVSDHMCAHTHTQSHGGTHMQRHTHMLLHTHTTHRHAWTHHAHTYTHRPAHTQTYTQRERHTHIPLHPYPKSHSLMSLGDSRAPVAPAISPTQPRDNSSSPASFLCPLLYMAGITPELSTSREQMTQYHPVILPRKERSFPPAFKFPLPPPPHTRHPPSGLGQTSERLPGYPWSTCTLTSPSWWRLSPQYLNLTHSQSKSPAQQAYQR